MSDCIFLPNILNNSAWQGGDPVKLSVLIPYYRDNPQALLNRLSAHAPLHTEVILYDDGSNDADLSLQMDNAVRQSTMPVQRIEAFENLGRSAARNALIKAARGKWVLFLDADMMPQTDAFLDQWMQCITNNNPEIAFGGFRVPARNEIAPALGLHQAFSRHSDCLSAKIRAQNPAKHVCTSNLLVKKDVLAQCPFDNGFSGWGWEDVEWAARAAAHHDILHIENPARHLGLESADTLVRRFRDSAPNYARFVHRHPELAQTLPSWKAAHLLKNIPGISLLRPVFAALARNSSGMVPMGLRIMALKLWRSSWYAKALS
jgi:glycosyltransferase involved in cell wall biosynthesis